VAIYDDRDGIERREARQVVNGHGALIVALIIVAVFTGLFVAYRPMSAKPASGDDRPAMTNDATN